MGFPCNQFAGQEPKDSEEVEACVRVKHNVNFPLMEKVHVNGPKTHPVYRFLRVVGDEGGPIGWNFCMFLVSPAGDTVMRYGASKMPSTIASDIDAHLDQAGQ